MTRGGSSEGGKEGEMEQRDLVEEFFKSYPRSERGEEQEVEDVGDVIMCFLLSFLLCVTVR